VPLKKSYWRTFVRKTKPLSVNGWSRSPSASILWRDQFRAFGLTYIIAHIHHPYSPPISRSYPFIVVRHHLSLAADCAASACQCNKFLCHTDNAAHSSAALNIIAVSQPYRFTIASSGFTCLIPLLLQDQPRRHWSVLFAFWLCCILTRGVGTYRTGIDTEPDHRTADTQPATIRTGAYHCYLQCGAFRRCGHVGIGVILASQLVSVTTEIPQYRAAIQSSWQW
jgi:hypothetical protein